MIEIASKFAEPIKLRRATYTNLNSVVKKYYITVFLDFIAIRKHNVCYFNDDENQYTYYLTAR